MIKYDYHTHSEYSIDSYTPLEKNIERAIQIGLDEIAATDHVDFYYPSGEIMGNMPIDSYVQSVLHAQKKYHGRIKVVLGIEFGLRPDAVKTATKIAQSYDFDFILGSMHEHISGMPFHRAEFYKGREKQAAYDDYFESLLTTINSCDCFDVVGHLDYIERYGHYQNNDLHYHNHIDRVDALLRAIIDKGKGIEINTSGYAYGLGHPHPRLDIVRRYLSLGGEILTVGSDAHTAKNIGQHFDRTYAFLKESGIKYLTTFEKRKPTMVKV